MRNIDEIQEFLERKGFQFELHTPGQSWRNGGVLFYWKGEKPKFFTFEVRGKGRYGRRTIDLVRLFPAEEKDGSWKFEDIDSTRVYADEKGWYGRSFSTYYGVKIVQLPEKFEDLEELVE